MGALDLRTGELRFDDPPLVVGPNLAYTQFEADPARARFAPFVTNPPHRSFRASVVIDGAPFVVVVFFRAERVVQVSVTIDVPEISGTSWEDYDAERVRRFHDEWLEERLGRGKPWHWLRRLWRGAEHHEPWGTIGSYLSPQDGSARISLHYGEAQP